MITAGGPLVNIVIAVAVLAGYCYMVRRHDRQGEERIVREQLQVSGVTATPTAYEFEWRGEAFKVIKDRAVLAGGLMIYQPGLWLVVYTPRHGSASLVGSWQEPGEAIAMAIESLESTFSTTK